jgi:hypothetical protein
VQRAVLSEPFVEGPLQVVAVSRAGLEEAEECVTDGHGGHCTQGVYAPCIEGVSSWPRRGGPDGPPSPVSPACEAAVIDVPDGEDQETRDPLMIALVAIHGVGDRP